ncbi:PP2C family serine/threonine-protein phosphatase [Alkalihalobacillus sp. LMS39]|uniref:PP2C family serine/threonine-protein phosphatase n=1 Tax=Alkalihalobacillus sp. LMS39 TaxID=2924032 RepID=UPI001FB3DAD8|nr:PP2C family serine/threonine-protein phosphatase [Alkalihalobacillus sp. LMS39]UOE94369.1 SpoIIE family protein phosphatase [Alkalihalobacillus sp. LMS39]
MVVEYKIHDHVKVAVYQQAKAGNYCCGDSYVMIETKQYFLCAIADGLGSGEGAWISSDEVMKMIKEFHHEPIEALMKRCNEALVGKRGAVLTVLKVDYEENLLHYSNVGNIGFIYYLQNGEVIRPIPTRGFLSGRKTTIKVERYPYKSGSAFLLYSDGMKLSSSKQLNTAMLQSPDEAADFIRENIENKADDLTVLIGQIR